MGWASMIHRVSGFVKACSKMRRQTILFAALTSFAPLAANAQTFSGPPGLATPASPRQAASNPGAPNPGPSSNPICVRLESQLAAVTQGSADPVRAERTVDRGGTRQADHTASNDRDINVLRHGRRS